MPIKEWLRNELFDWSKDLIFDKENYTNLPLDMIKIKKSMPTALAQQLEFFDFPTFTIVREQRAYNLAIFIVFYG